MPWRLIGFIVLFGIFVVFISFNLGNACDINLIVHTFTGVPVYLTALFSFVLGMLCTVPFMLSRLLKKKSKTPADSPAGGVSSKTKKKAEKKSASDFDGDLGGENGPYGIN
jgi:uncharacterized integral membrane protein